MKVTYTQNRFEIDGVEIINPEVLPNVYYKDNRIHIDGVDPGEDWDLPDNIIAEKVTQVLNIHNEWVESIYEFDVVGPAIKEVYRLKLKEPLVDTGSKDMLIKYLRNAEWLLDGNFNTNVIDALNQIRQAIEIVTRK